MCKAYFLVLTLFLQVVVNPEPNYAEDKPQLPIKLGAIFSLSSFGAAYGIGEMRAAKMAVEDINRQGGVLGRPLELIIEDNGSDLKKTVSAFHKLVGINKVAAVLGPNWAEFSEVVAPLARSLKVVTLSPSGYRKSNFAPGSFFFTSWVAHSVSTAPFSRYILSKRPQKLAMVVTDNGYHEEICGAIEGQLDSGGIKVAEKDKVNPDERDFRSMIMRFKTQDFDTLVLCLLHEGNISTFLRQAHDLGYGGHLFSASDIVLDSAVNENPSIAEGVVFFDWPKDKNSDFAKRFQSRYGELPEVSSPLAYDSVFVLKQALEHCNGQGGASLRACLLSVDYQGISGKIAFNDDGTLKSEVSSTKIYEVREGKFREIP